MLDLSNAAGLLGEKFDPAVLIVESETAVDIVKDIRTAWPALNSWVNFPLLNSSGDHADLTLRPYVGAAKSTAYARRLPQAMNVVDTLVRSGFDVCYARIAVLIGRDVLRPHVDMYEAIRLIVPLNEHGADFRHVFGDFVITMRTGELWAVDGKRCHGAANLSQKANRVALLVDARRDSRSAGWAHSWRLPTGRNIDRPKWTRKVRRRLRREFLKTLDSEGCEAAERSWHFTSFEYRIGPEAAYRELISIFADLSRLVDDPVAQRRWAERAKFWTERNCVCVPM